MRGTRFFFFFLVAQSALAQGERNWCSCQFHHASAQGYGKCSRSEDRDFCYIFFSGEGSGVLAFETGEPPIPGSDYGEQVEFTRGLLGESPAMAREESAARALSRALRAAEEPSTEAEAEVEIANLLDQLPELGLYTRRRLPRYRMTTDVLVHQIAELVERSVPDPSRGAQISARILNNFPESIRDTFLDSPRCCPVLDVRFNDFRYVVSPLCFEYREGDFSVMAKFGGSPATERCDAFSRSGGR